MKKEMKLFFFAISISFLGSLPLGALNLSVASFVLHQNLPGAVYFSCGSIVVEMILVRIALMVVKRLEALKRFYRLFSLATGLLLLGLAWSILSTANSEQKFQDTLPFTGFHPLLSGLLLSLINPLHLPFWMGWTAVLKSKKLLEDRHAHYNVFVAAIGSGTALAFMIYGVAGNYLKILLERQQMVLNWILGIALLITAIIQLYKTLILWRDVKKFRSFLVKPVSPIAEEIFNSYPNVNITAIKIMYVNGPNTTQVNVSINNPNSTSIGQPTPPCIPAAYLTATWLQATASDE